MGRPAEGWSLRPRGKNLAVRFTHAGRQVERSTGYADPERASAAAVRIYAAVVAGRARPVRARSERNDVGHNSLAQVGAQWLTSCVGTLGDRTIAGYARYLEVLLGPFFGGIERVTTERARDYMTWRLSVAQATTLSKELSTLRSVVQWYYGDSAPIIPKVPKRALGTKYEKRRRGQATELSPAEVRAILKAIPERTRDGYPARAYFTVLYETALRPATLNSLSVPENYRRGRKALTLERSQDKARWGRPIPLTDAARAALDAVAPLSGLIFGARDWWQIFRAAVKKAELPTDKLATVCPYDLRHARLTHWVDNKASLTGVQYLAGHKLLATTTKYVRPNLKAAEAVVGKRRNRSLASRR